MKLKETVRKGYYAYEVPETARRKLQQRHTPQFPEFIGHHVTVMFSVPYDPLFDNKTANITTYGFVSEDGLEAFLVSVDGEKTRSDGNLYHLTWSLDRSKGKKPVDSNILAKAALPQRTFNENFTALLKFFPFS